jgi:hypothetical protein
MDFLLNFNLIFFTFGEKKRWFFGYMYVGGECVWPRWVAEKKVFLQGEKTVGFRFNM